MGLAELLETGDAIELETDLVWIGVTALVELLRTVVAIELL